MPYQWLTWSAAQAELSSRLSDTSQQFTVSAEVPLYLALAMQMWNSLTAFWVVEYPATLTPPLASNWQQANGSGSPRIQTQTNVSLYTLMEYMLLEPAVGGGTWLGTPQFNLQMLSQAVQGRRDEALQIGASNMVEIGLPIGGGANRVSLPDNALDVRRVRFVPAQGSAATLERGDAESFRTFTPSYLQSTLSPLRYDVISGPPLAITLDSSVPVAGVLQTLIMQSGTSLVPPNVYLVDSGGQSWLLGISNLGAYTTTPVAGGAGVSGIVLSDMATSFTYNLTVGVGGALGISPSGGVAQANIPILTPNNTSMAIAVNNNAIVTILVASVTSALNIPDDYAWVPLFGALADVLSSQEESLDLPRAKYCIERYSQGLELLRKAPWLLEARVNGVAVATTSAIAADRFNVNWQTNAGAFPQVVTPGTDLYAASPTPTANTNVVLVMVGNAPIPTVGSQQIQVPRDVMDAILDEAEHLACFKKGGSEFLASMSLHESFLATAKRWDTRGRLEGIFPTTLRSDTPREEIQQPRFSGGDK